MTSLKTSNHIIGLALGIVITFSLMAAFVTPLGRNPAIVDFEKLSASEINKEDITFLSLHMPKNGRFFYLNQNHKMYHPMALPRNAKSRFNELLMELNKLGTRRAYYRVNTNEQFIFEFEDQDTMHHSRRLFWTINTGSDLNRLSDYEIVKTKKDFHLLKYRF